MLLTGLDGYLARVMDWQTDLGKILDPIADKVLLIGTILILWLNGYIPLFVLAIFVLRDLMIIIGAAFHMTVYETATPAPNVFLAKVKTSIQLCSLCGFLLSLYLGNALLLFLSYFLFFLALIITLQTGLSYTIATFKR